MNTRREFLHNGAITVAVFAVFSPVMSRWWAAGCPEKQSLDRMPYSMLAAQVNTTFRVCGPSGRAVELTLLKAPTAGPLRPGRRPAPDAGNEKFSLVFRGPMDDLLAAAIHPFEHDRLGRFEMYIGRIGTGDTRGVRYESVFNRPPPAGAIEKSN